MTIETESNPVPDAAFARRPVGFVGLGDMGGRIARRIALAGHRLTVFDLRAGAMDELVALGAAAAAGAAAVAASSEIVCVCVVDDDQLTGVVDGMAFRPGSVLVVHSSVRPQTVVRLAEQLARQQVTVVDAPVSGSRPAADAGTLTALLGGDTAVIDSLRPLLAAYCSNTVHAGGLGAGQLLKIANNVLLHMNHLIVVEAARFAREHGISEAALIEAANVSSGRSWVTETWGLLDDMLFDHPMAGTEGIYSIMSKEMWHAVEISRASLVPMPLTALGTQISKSYFQERAEVVRRSDL